MLAAAIGGAIALPNVGGQVAMLSTLTYTAMADAIFTHPLLAEEQRLQEYKPIPAIAKCYGGRV